MTSTIKRIDRLLAQYYKLCGADYQSLFEKYCEENGIEDVGMAEELDNIAEDNLLVDFDDDFPMYKDPENRYQFIHDLLKYCHAHNSLPPVYRITPTEDVFKISFTMFDIDEVQMQKAREIWKLQMQSVVWPEVIYAIAVELQSDYSLLMHLADLFDVERGEHQVITQQNLSITKWWRATSIVQKLREYKTSLLMFKSTSTADYLMMSAVAAWLNRIRPPLRIERLGYFDFVINDSLREICNYIVAASQFIGNLINKKADNAVCPFQVDFVIAVGGITRFVSNDDDDDDDEDNHDAKMDIPAKWTVDIYESLKRNNLHYLNIKDQIIKDTKYEASEARWMNQNYNYFVKELSVPFDGDDCKGNPRNTKMHPQNERFIVFIDRRKLEKDEDSITFFEPPENCRRIPEDHIAEWYFGASGRCLIPGLNDNEYFEPKRYNEGGTIGALSRVGHQMMTLSFHVEQEHDVRSYLYWAGGCVRFTGKCMEKHLSKVFVRNKENEEFVRSNECRKMAKEFDKYCVDKRFDGFCAEYGIFDGFCAEYGIDK